MSENPYSPRAFFTGLGDRLPRVLLSPQKYVQGPGVLNHLGEHLSLLAVEKVAVLGSKRCLENEAARAINSIKSVGIDVAIAQFGGECSLYEIENQVETLSPEKPDFLVALGGGKTVDAGRCIAERLSVPIVIAPTLASNDAPCSALSVVYTTEGVQESVEFFARNPTLVIVDTEVVANADERYLVAGIGDAMATWYEAKVCRANTAAVTPAGARPTLAAYAMSMICAETLYEFGEEAIAAVAESRNNESLEKVVEANTLLSGIGFESGGLAMAHPLALAYTRINRVHNNYLHGEIVAISTMAQLALEESTDMHKAARFFARVGLPVHLGQLSMSPDNLDELDILAEVTMTNPNAHHMPIKLSHSLIKQSILDAHHVGVKISDEVGDQAYRRLHH